MSYTVHELAALADVSVRTLHYYDQIGLLKPESLAANGYRQYGRPQLERLQQILFFRELEFPLDEIRELLDSPRFDRAEALRDQRRLLELKRSRLNRLIRTVTGTLNDMENTNQPFSSDPTAAAPLQGSLSQSQIDAYKAEARQKWGKTDAYKQSQERTKHWTKADYQRNEAERLARVGEIVALMDRGIADPAVQAKMAEVRHSLEVFYDCSLEMFRSLGQMYAADERFAAYYEKFRPGLAVFMRDAIALYCDEAAAAESKT